MEPRRQEPWVQADRTPQSVLVGNLAARRGALAASRAEDLSLHALGPALVAVADDDQHQPIPLLRALRVAGHEVFHAPGPRSCVRLVEDSTRPIVALVCCTEMKEMSGFELARRVIQRRPDIRVLLIFRDGSDNQDRARASALGYAHLVQSSSPREICSQLARLLGTLDPGDPQPL